MNELTEKKNSHAKQNHDKSGKKAKKKDLRRLEAIARQIEEIERVKRNAKKAKNKKEAQRKIDHAELTLQLVRGGQTQKDIVAKFKAVKAEEVAPKA